jgi:hypothetical protein
VKANARARASIETRPFMAFFSLTLELSPS